MLAVSPGSLVGAALGATRWSALRERGKERRGATAQATVVAPLRGPVPGRQPAGGGGVGGGDGCPVATSSPAARRASDDGGIGSQPAQVGSEDAAPAIVLSSSTTAHPEPGVLWQRRGRDAAVGELFAAPRRWRVVWAFDCRNFAAYGGGNFKLSGAGAFNKVAVQRLGVRGRGSRRGSGPPDHRVGV
jgi:hypothetical protein